MFIFKFTVKSEVNRTSLSINCNRSAAAFEKVITTKHPLPVKVLVRKDVGNPADYFDKTFADYKEGFSANGLLRKQLMHGLNNL